MPWRPDPIDTTILKTLGIAPNKEPQTLFALRFLALIDDTGSPTSNFDELRIDFKETLKKLVRDAYSKLFETIPIRRISQQTLVNFFMAREYSEDTAEYQAKLFVELCSNSEIDLPNVEPAFKRARFQG